MPAPQFFVTASDVIWGMAVILTVVIVTAMWVTVTIMDRRAHKRAAEREAERVKVKEDEAA
jgi:hypothetical protein